METRTWFITGINRGLGRCLAEALLENGQRVAGTARNLKELVPLQETYGDLLWTAELDLVSPGAIQEAVNRAFADLGHVDYIVNNAGYSLAGAAEECPEDMIRHQLDTNLLGSILVVRAALPHLRAQGGGRILQISSAAGQMAYAGLSLYIASKWGIEGFIESVAQEVAPFNIEATIFEPGGIRTDFGGTGILAPAIEAYRSTPANLMREGVESLRSAGQGSSQANGDPAKMAQVIIASTTQSPAPLRVVMGSDVYTPLLNTYESRTTSLKAQKETAYSTDF